MKKGTFEAMLCRAILNSKRSGCSYKAILNYITGNYEGANNTSALKRALKKGLADEILTRDKKMYYRLSKQGKEKMLRIIRSGACSKLPPSSPEFGDTPQALCGPSSVSARRVTTTK